MKKSYCIQHTHLFRAGDYECSVCHAIYSKPHTSCPKCKSKMGKLKYDASWVDEMAEYDAIFGEDDN